MALSLLCTIASFWPLKITGFCYALRVIYASITQDVHHGKHQEIRKQLARTGGDGRCMAVKNFSTKAEAVAWANQRESEIRSGATQYRAARKTLDEAFEIAP
jgi:hypothetical protein